MSSSFTISEIPLSLCDCITVRKFCLRGVDENLLKCIASWYFDRVRCKLFVEKYDPFEFWLPDFYYCLVFKADNIGKTAAIFARGIHSEIYGERALIFELIIDCFSVSENPWSIWCTQPPTKIGFWNNCSALIYHISCFKRDREGSISLLRI